MDGTNGGVQGYPVWSILGDAGFIQGEKRRLRHINVVPAEQKTHATQLGTSAPFGTT